MQIKDIESLRRHHPAWRLLRAEHAPLVISFLGRIFIEQNTRSIPATGLVSQLDDELYRLNQPHPEPVYPRPARAYLDDWASPESGWLRKFYPTGSDDASFDATADLEKAYAWVASLAERTFVGTESRLNTVFELLRQMAVGGESDPDVRLADLERRRAALEAEITRVRSGQVDVLDPTGLRDRYQQFTSMARALLADFREVEDNFRALDRQMRERVATWDRSKGELLDEVLLDRSSITESDQGRSFHAFYDFLLSQERQEQFVNLLERVHAMPQIGAVDSRIARIHHDWLEAGERTQATVRLLSEQLRRFLDDKVWLENRRVIDLLRSIEARALELRDLGDGGPSIGMDATAPTVVLPMERPLYAAVARATIDSSGIERASEDVDASLLFEQVYVDPTPLALAVRQQLQRRDQVTLADVLAHRPLDQGLAELVTYLALEDPSFDVLFDETTRQSVTWTDAEGLERQATVPTVRYLSARAVSRVDVVAPSGSGGSR